MTSAETEAQTSIEEQNWRKRVRIQEMPNPAWCPGLEEQKVGAGCCELHTRLCLWRGVQHRDPSCSSAAAWLTTNETVLSRAWSAKGGTLACIALAVICFIAGCSGASAFVFSKRKHHLQIDLPELALEAHAGSSLQQWADRILHPWYHTLPRNLF